AVFFDRLNDRRAPAAADVEQPLPGLQVALPQGQIVLGDLRLFQRHVVALVVRARVKHRWAEKQPVEIVRQVVMRLDVLIRRSELSGSHDFSFASESWRRSNDPSNLAFEKTAPGRLLSADQ